VTTSCFPKTKKKKLSLSLSYSEVVRAAIASHLLAVGCSLSQAPSSSTLSLSVTFSCTSHVDTNAPRTKRHSLRFKQPPPPPSSPPPNSRSSPSRLSLSSTRSFSRALATIDHQRQYISLSISRSQPPNPACLLPPNSTHRPLPCFKSASSSSSSSSSSLLSIVAGERRGSGRQ